MKTDLNGSTQMRVGVKEWKSENLITAINAMSVNICDSGYAEVRETWHSEPTALPFTRIYIVQDGTAQISDGGQTIPMKPNTVYVVPAGVPCSYSCNDIMRKLYFHVNVFRSDRYDLLWGSRQIGVFPVDGTFVERMIAHYRGEGYPDAVMVQAELLNLLNIYLQTYPLPTASRSNYSPIVAETIDYIHRNLSAKLRNGELAKRLFVSRTYLTDRFRKETGVSLGKYIDEQLMFEAQLRLSQTDTSIRTVSKDLGFSDQFYFSRRFKQVCGVTPLQYRKNSR